ncbi:MAG: phenylalanine--tRNA ligase subunit beta [Rubrobacteraceae bacterium]|nr:phenylalanine--tRNA ligase subunit beta [Rubrobacteraceae bacterium]MBA3617099.1 phenylalanine--tRNA ligase subunit beta [Rubrobacteraceae bacterium]MDQ3250677.1 phenylalanine--tRNA ligase subunit beta [Actinomycetota bacterium]MDQ3436327.1 phenylalanine--tRNA ligase subunit beta [Actinomycetota bacterium]
MRVPLSWLHEYLDFDLRADELVDLFSLRSQEIDGVYRLGVIEGEVVIGEVVEFGPHPNADRLFVAKVDLGGREVQIVAGAPNPYPGARVPVVLPGSAMSDGTRLRKAKLRGLESYGMMMSERELGISADHGGILLLDDSYEVGRPVAEYFPVGETVLDIDVTPNRPDLWGMIGVARELAAILKTEYRIPEPSFETGGKPTRDFGLRVEAGDLCPRYDLRRISDLESGQEAPLWMRRRIFAGGMRPLNAVVDATNYVMLETGQPIHAFDAARVREGIVVRRGRREEKITLLDGSTRVLDEEMLVIADEERGLVIAGMMGAEDAEVGDETTDALIEVANFEGRNILQTSQKLGLRTDASGRFERGLDPNMVSYAMDRVSALLTRAPGGKPADDTLSHYPEPVVPWRVPLRLGRAELLLGMPVQMEEAVERLEALGCEVEREDVELWATVPTFRRDLRREADLVEEVGRLIGLDRVPETLPAVPQTGGLTETQQRTRSLRRLLADLGLSEAITYPFGPERWTEDLSLEGGAVRLENPLSAEGGYLRTSILPGLLDAAARNKAFGARGGALFEVGNVFFADVPQDDLREVALRFRMTGELDQDTIDADRAIEQLGGRDPASTLMGVREASRIGVVLAGTVRPAGWNVPEIRADFYEAKGIVERLVPDARFVPATRPYLHPGRSAAVLVGDEEAGWVGELHPEVAGRFGLDGWPVAALEVVTAACQPAPEPRFEPFVNVPAVARDLAVLVEERIPVGAMLRSVQSFSGPLLTEVRVFDVYAGSPVPPGQKSVAFGFTFQGEKTLTDEEVDAEVGRVLSRLEDEFGVRVRS